MKRGQTVPRGMRVFVRPLLVVGGLLIAIALGEGMLRLVLPVAPDKYYPWPPGLTHLFRPNPAVMPGISGLSHFTVNRWGLRADDFSEAQKYRILAVGGSTTECLYLDDREAWPRLLQEQMTARGGKEKVWVGNAGRSGMSSREHVAYLKYLPPQYPRLDAVLVLAGGNDLLSRIQVGATETHFLDAPTQEEAVLYRAFSVFPGNSRLEFLDATGYGRLWRQLSRRFYDRADHPQIVLDDVGKCYVEARQRRAAASVKSATLPDLASSLASYQEQLEAMIALARSQAIRPIFLTQATLWRADLSPDEEGLLWFGYMVNSPQFYSTAALVGGMDRFNERMREVCAKNGVECLDLAGMLPKDTSIFYDDMHFNENGSRKVAAIVADWWESHP